MRVQLNHIRQPDTVSVLTPNSKTSHTERSPRSSENSRKTHMVEERQMGGVSAAWV